MEKRKSYFSKLVFNDIIDYINVRSPDSISATELQQVSGYSKRQLDRIFLKHTGLTANSYVESIRFYRFFLALRFTTITPREICSKYKIKDFYNFVKKFKSLTGSDPGIIKYKGEIKVSLNIERDSDFLSKKYLSCSFVSLFNYPTRVGGSSHKVVKPLAEMHSSHYSEKEKMVGDFCKKYHIERNDVWSCSKFNAYDADSYCFEFHAGIILNEKSDFEHINLQGDYLLFKWVGKPEDTYPWVLNIYDNLFFKFGVSRKDGYDIERREKLEGIKKYYVFSYYIPIVLDEAILSAINN